MSSVTQLNATNFDAFIKGSDLPVLVDLWAVWCGPCRRIAPVLDEIAVEYAAKLRIAKVNVDQNPDVSRKYNVMGIPTLLLFKNGALVSRVVGAKPKSALLTDIEPFL